MDLLETKEKTNDVFNNPRTFGAVGSREGLVVLICRPRAGRGWIGMDGFCFFHVFSMVVPRCSRFSMVIPCFLPGCANFSRCFDAFGLFV